MHALQPSFSIGSALALSLMLVCPGLAAQPVPSPGCLRAGGAPAWLPCGPDRVLGGDDLRAEVIKAGTVTKMVITSGASGRKFFADYHPDGKLAGGPLGGGNFGREWKIEGNQVCRKYYQFNNGRFDCATFELREGKLILQSGDGGQNPIDSIEFQSQ